MNEIKIECPHCKKPFELTEALAFPLLEAERRKVTAEVERRLAAERDAAAQKASAAITAEYAAKLKASEAALSERDAKLRQAQAAELALRKERDQLEQEKREVDLTVQRRVDAEKKAVAEQAAAVTAGEYAAKLKASEAAVADRDAKLRQAQEAELKVRTEREKLEQEKREVELTVQRRVDAEKKAAAEQAAAATAGEYAAKLKAADAALAAKEEKVRAAEQAELEARKARQEAEEAKRQAELTVVRRVDEELAKVRENALRQRDEEYRLKLGEKDKQLGDLRQQIEELRRKGESASQQLVGDVLELDLLDLLKSAFPGDEFERVKKGQSGADVLQTVRNRSGVPCGRILWETKRTKTFSDAWLGKLRHDQREIKADVAVLMTETLPDTVRNIEMMEEVWVTGIPTAIGLATALRKNLIEIASARRAAAGAGTVKDLTYGYLTGQEFRQRVRGTIEPVLELRADLEKEKRATLKQWAARDKQLDRITSSMAGLYGDLQGIVGSSLPAVEELALLENDESAGKATPALAIVKPDAAGSAEAQA
jgi:hypothetical protein